MIVERTERPMVQRSTQCRQGSVPDQAKLPEQLEVCLEACSALHHQEPWVGEAVLIMRAKAKAR